MKEKISKIIMGIGSLFIFLIAIYCLIKGEIVGFLMIFIIAILSFPLFQDWIDKKYGIQSEYYKELRFFMTFFTPLICLLLAFGIIKIMSNQEYEEYMIIEIIKKFLQISIYIIYLVVFFMYSKKESSQKNKYIFFGTVYFISVLISYIPDETMVLILNNIPNDEKLTMESYNLLIEAIIEPIKEAILTYIIFDTVRKSKDDKKDNKIENNREKINMQFDKNIKFKVDVKDNKTGYKYNYSISVKQNN